MKTILLILLFSFSLNAQERVLLHIGRNGQQEAIPLKKGERAQDVIARIENEKTSMISPDKSLGLVDTLRYYPNESSLTTNFGWTHQDIALQWYTPAAGGRVTEFWWRNYERGGTIRKATIRAWRVDPKLATRPSSVQTKFLGHYKDPNDGDGMVTPFKPTTGNTWFYGNGGADSATWNFDPLGTEVAGWYPGGVQLTIDSNVWQGIKLKDWGDSMNVRLGELFGFTISNDTKKSDILTLNDERMEILSWANANTPPYHSYKWYETGRLSPGLDNGWHMRGDYEWGMYVVIEYTTCRPPTFRILTPTSFNTTLSTKPRDLCFEIIPGGCNGFFDSLECVTVFFKKGSPAKYDSIQFCTFMEKYCLQLPGGKPGDTIYWYIRAVDKHGNVTQLSVRSYKIFKKTQPRLFIYNNTQFPLETGTLIYTSKLNKYDRWSAPYDGTVELDQLFSLFDHVILADGSFPSRNIYQTLKKWLDTGTPENKKNLFFTSQDYGCYIQPICADTTFPSGSFEEKYLGIKTLGPQDQGPTNRPVKIIPQADSITNYIIKYNVDSATTLWHHPTFELGFAAYPDFMTPTASAKPIFKDGLDQNVYAVRNAGTNFNTMFMALDAGSLQFRSDTSITKATDDPKYRWIVDVQSLANVFLDAVTGVRIEETNVPAVFSLRQNYPNPFNPFTTIEYSVGTRSVVTISIYNTLGQKVATVVNETKDAGLHNAIFSAQFFASGLYFYEMRAHQIEGSQAGSFVSVKKMLLMK
ncbi:MAG: T9SS type A sorting domain-containing protein [Bacteroidota bacterium]